MDQLLSLALKYGPTLVLDVIDACKKRGITIAEVEAIFADVKPYSAFGIKDANAAAAAPASSPALPAANPFAQS